MNLGLRGSALLVEDNPIPDSVSTIERWDRSSASRSSANLSSEMLSTAVRKADHVVRFPGRILLTVSGN